MFANFNKTMRANFTPEGKISTLEKLIQVIEDVNTRSENIGKCITCKHYAYEGNSQSSSLDPFINVYCDIKPKTYRVCDCHSCDGYEKKNYKSQLDELKVKIDLLKGETK